MEFFGKQNNIQKYGEVIMKIGKYKGKTLDEIRADKDGKRYLYWFVDNVINEQNEKFYFKLMSYVRAVRNRDPDFLPETSQNEEEKIVEST